MSKSTGLAIAAAVFGVLAIAMGSLASSNYSSAMNYHGPVRWGGRDDAAALAAVPTGIAWVCVVACVLCVILALAMRQPRPASGEPADRGVDA